ncbi:MAG: alcohol dehydrogenase [Cypionkella sp.]|uniref:glycerol dehydrogenase n=1 Tax=Cypionkella sp. TaxID=2811411 RepID=UPI00261F8058|nr:glycerol dehydrogenase [Cypionkella sp.]MDB5659693.1 alcohol dehydrogenase [Cypionkella sp.]
MSLPSSVCLFGAPHRYYQGPGAFDLLGQVAAPFGPNPLIVADAFVLQMLGDRLAAVCAASGLTPILRPFEGEITYPAIEALIASLSGVVPGIAVGIGGGKSLDAAKAVALKLRLPVVTVPTIASNDSPTSAAIAMYDEHHTMIAVDRLHRSPEAVLVDTALIAKAPLRFLLAGIGDAISKKFEADGCRDGTGVTPFGTRPTLTAIAIADACYATLRRHGSAGVVAAARGEVTPDLEAVIEATLLMSGLGFENGGLSLAHSLTRGLVKVRGTRDAIHGDQIAWALLVQLAAEGRADVFIRELVQFYREIGLPTCLAQLGLHDATPAEVEEIARWTMTAPHLANLAVPIDAALIVAAIRRAEELSEHTDV